MQTKVVGIELNRRVLAKFNILIPAQWNEKEIVDKLHDFLSREEPDMDFAEDDFKMVVGSPIDEPDRDEIRFVLTNEGEKEKRKNPWGMR